LVFKLGGGGGSAVALRIKKKPGGKPENKKTGGIESGSDQRCFFHAVRRSLLLAGRVRVSGAGGKIIGV